MKQNYSIVFHPTQNSLISCYFRRFFMAAAILAFCASVNTCIATETAQPEPYKVNFDPAAGFRPAQANFTKIFLQLAGSLEYYGSPEPYIRHVMAEHARIDALYNKATGRTGSSRPPYLTDNYLENLLAGWNKLAPVLKLDDLSRLAGRDMRYAILGGWNKSVAELVSQENALTDPEKSEYSRLLTKDYFTRADFPSIDAFYKSTYDKLTAEGQNQISTRTQRGMLSPEKRTIAIQGDKGGTVVIDILNEHQTKTLAYIKSANLKAVSSDDLENALRTRLKLDQEGGDGSHLPITEHDALQYSHAIQNAFLKRFEHARKQSKTPEQAATIEKALVSMVENLVVVAHSEYLAALRAQMTE